jgi:hypothetical protein
MFFKSFLIQLLLISFDCSVKEKVVRVKKRNYIYMNSKIFNTLSTDHDNCQVFQLVQCYSAGLRAGLSEVPFSAGAGNFSLHHRVHTGCGVHPTSYPMGARSSFLGGKTAGIVKLTTYLHLVPSRMRGAIRPLPNTPS